MHIVEVLRASLSRLAFVAVAAAGFATSPQAGERFVHARFDELEFEGEPPRLPEASAAGWSSSKATWLAPRVVLDGAGEAVLVYEDESEWGLSWSGELPSLAVRFDGESSPSGRLYFPDADVKTLRSHRFRVRSSADGEPARAAYWRGLRALCLRELAHNNPGAAWFRHRLRVARRELGEADAGQDVASFARSASFDETLELLSGARSISENLDLERALRIEAQSGETVDVASIEGVTTAPFDWKAAIQGLKPELDPLARAIPADQHAVFFPTFDAMIAVFDEIDANGSPLLSLFDQRTTDELSKQRYQDQLCLPLSTFARTFGPALVSSVAITGSDPFLPSGTDLAIVFETKQAAVLAGYVAARQAQSGATKLELDVAGVRIVGVRSDDRRISSFVAELDGVVVVANSTAQIERVVGALRGASPSLASTDEYVYFRDRYRRHADGESALVVLSDATIRRWAGPRSRIGESRRTRARAAMAELTMRHLDAIARGTVEVGASAADPAWPVTADFVWTKDGVRSPKYGTLAFSTPIAELDVERATEAEKNAYDEFRRGFESRWREAFDPIALRIVCAPDALAADLTVMPLVAGTEYRELRDLTLGAKLAPHAGDRHPEAVLHFAFALSRKSELAQMLSLGSGGLGASLGADPLGWLGDGVALYADDDPIWKQLGAAMNDGQAMELVLYRLPIGMHVEVKDPLKLAGFLTGLRAMVDQAVPGLTVWETKTWREQPYVKIGAGDGLDFDEALAEAALYYVAMPDALVLSMREDVVQRAIDRRAARKRGELDDSKTSPWIGESAALRLEPAGSHLWLDLFGGELRDASTTTAWTALAVLNDWKRAFPEVDPVALYERVLGARLVAPDGTGFEWNAELATMQSSSYGSPAAPREGPSISPVLTTLGAIDLGLGFEGEGLRARARLERGQ